MQFNLNKLKSWGILSGAISTLCFAATPSYAVIVNLSPGNFSTVQGTVDNNVGINSGINTSSGNQGFDSFFTDTFLLLGGTSTDADISSSIGAGSPIAESTSFRINDNNGISIAFNYAFDGTETNSFDEFNIKLVDSDTFAEQIAFARETGTSTGYGSGAESVLLSNVAPGDYFIEIALDEAGRADRGPNSAAGFNNITVSAVPFEFSPALGLLAVGSVFGGSSYLKRKKAAKNILK